MYKYIYLKKGEIIERGDEYFDNGKWRKSLCYGKELGSFPPYMLRPYRRFVKVKSHPATNIFS